MFLQDKIIKFRGLQSKIPLLNSTCGNHFGFWMLKKIREVVWPKPCLFFCVVCVPGFGTAMPPQRNLRSQVWHIWWSDLPESQTQAYVA